MNRNRKIRTLVVDDSAFARKAVREMLLRDPELEVAGMARDGHEAIELVEQLKPDVVTCDLLMPRLDGVSFVREQMRRRPLPILILTSTPQDGEQAIEAMDAGAVEVVRKPTARATNDLMNIEAELVFKVKAAAQALPERLHPPFDSTAAPALPAIEPARLRRKIVVLAISTGGPQALRYLLPQLPAAFPVPIAIVLHMPVGYTELFAQKLNQLSSLKVAEARAGDLLQPGLALLAPAGQHLVLRGDPRNGVRAELTSSPATLHRPSADVLFQSAVECYGNGVLGVVMTGMGDDGKQGAAWIKAQGGTVLTEAEESCVIYGMPRAVVEAGLSDRAAPLERMAQVITTEL